MVKNLQRTERGERAPRHVDSLASPRASFSRLPRLWSRERWKSRAIADKRSCAPRSAPPQRSFEAKGRKSLCIYIGLIIKARPAYPPGCAGSSSPCRYSSCPAAAAIRLGVDTVVTACYSGARIYLLQGEGERASRENEDTNRHTDIFLCFTRGGFFLGVKLVYPPSSTRRFPIERWVLSRVSNGSESIMYNAFTWRFIWVYGARANAVPSVFAYKLWWLLVRREFCLLRF